MNLQILERWSGFWEVINAATLLNDWKCTQIYSREVGTLFSQLTCVANEKMIDRTVEAKRNDERQ